MALESSLSPRAANDITALINDEIASVCVVDKEEEQPIQETTEVVNEENTTPETNIETEITEQ